MKTFEEKYTAWIDGRLSGSDLADFEAELARTDHAAGEKEDSIKLGTLLRSNYKAPELKNTDFFNHQLMQRIAAEQPTVKPATQPAATSWSLSSLAWAGAFCMAIVAGIFFFAIPKGGVQNTTGNEYVAQITNVRSDDPAITATTFHSKDNKLTVIWLDGLEYLPVKEER